jgi:glucosamine 6-phosphate synthetase-like amidotransferase/phosphosugar isomerase protein
MYEVDLSQRSIIIFQNILFSFLSDASAAIEHTKRALCLEDDAIAHIAERR